MGKGNILHGDPMDNNEVACIKSTLPFPLGLDVGRNMEGKRKFLGFLLLSPILVVIRVCFKSKECGRIFMFFLN